LQTITIDVCGTVQNLILSRIPGGVTDITPLCDTQASRCNGGGGPVGVEEHIYMATVVLPPGCNDIQFDYSLCCRNGSINTLTVPTNQSISVFTNIDGTLSLGNSSPIFNNTPTNYTCVNEPVVYNHGVFDPDGDSLFFSLGDCYQNTSINQLVTYNAAYSGINPLLTISPIQVNPYSGALSFTPTSAQVGVLCMRVQEYRNGVLIGTTIRDIQFTVLNCINEPNLCKYSSLL
jgi:hypothetical protein